MANDWRVVNATQAVSDIQSPDGAVKNPVSVATPIQLMWSHVLPTDYCAIAAGLNRMCR
jgi:hypothetical protein